MGWLAIQMALHSSMNLLTLMSPVNSTLPMHSIRAPRNGSAGYKFHGGRSHLLSSRILLALLAAGIFCAPVEAADRSQARSMVITRQGIVATEHPLASQIGATMLAQGGNAVDAAVAANAAMGAFAPMANGMGGDLFVMVYEARTGKLYGLNASGWAPAGLTPEFLRSKGVSEMPQSGIQSVTVPGAVDGWDKLLKRFGRKRLPAVLAPAIRYAEEGFPVSEIFASYWADSVRNLRQNTNAAQTFLPNGRAPRPGEIFHNPDLAWSLKQVAAHGRKAFYEGAVGKRVLAGSKELGGTLTAEDLASFSSEWVEPISTTYHGGTVWELPPNGQGIAALMMLNLMENFPLAEFGPGSANALHVMIEAKKLAYADMVRFVCDPKFDRVPVAGMLSKDYACERAKLIDTERRMARWARAGRRGRGRTQPICALWTRKGTWSPTSRATTTRSAPASSRAARVSRCRIAGGFSAWRPAVRMC